MQNISKELSRTTKCFGEIFRDISFNAIKWAGVRAETGICIGINTSKGIAEGAFFIGETIGHATSPIIIEGGRKLGLFGLDDDAVYNYALNNAHNNMNLMMERWSGVPSAMATGFFKTIDYNNIYNFLFNPDLSLHDCVDYGQSAFNTGFAIYGVKNLTCAAGSKITSSMNKMGPQLVTAEGFVIDAGPVVASSTAIRLPVNSLLSSSMYFISRGNNSGLPGRNGALNQAKRDAGIPSNQHPEKVESVPMRSAPHEGGHVIKDANGNVIYTREYHYTNSDGQKIIIQEHSVGHVKGVQEPHFNVRPAENPRTGSVPGTQDHYPFNK